MINIEEDDFGMLADIETFPKKCEQIIKKAGRKSGRDGVNDLKNNSPNAFGRGGDGSYARNWALRDKSSLAGGIEYVIHNKTRWMLVHLLEDGHALIRNGVYIGHVAPVKHFYKSVRKAGVYYVKYIEDGLRKID